MNEWHNDPDDNSDLSQFDEEFERAEVEDREFESVPDGKYQVNVERVEITSAKTSGNKMLKWTLRILGPQCRNQVMWRNNMIVSPENLRWLKQDLNTCGLYLERLSDLRQRLGELLDLKIEVTKRTKGEYENIYLNRRIVIEDVAPEAGDDGPLPF